MTGYMWNGGWNTPQDHSSRVEDVFVSDETLAAETERRQKARAPGFTSTRAAEGDEGVTER